jgi:hypothetical protein
MWKIRKQPVLFLEFLCSVDDLCFKDSLKRLSSNNCHLDENNLDTIMLKIRPKFENLSNLDLRDNNIQNMHPLLNKIKNNDDAEFVPSKPLRILDLYENPIFEQMKDDPEEKTDMLSFLCRSIYNIGGYERSHYDSKINKGGTDGSGDRRSLPLSMWPSTVLVRAHENSDQIYNLADTDDDDDDVDVDVDDDEEFFLKRDATGIYDLFRNGLVGRHDWNWNDGVDNNNSGIDTHK